MAIEEKNIFRGCRMATRNGAVVLADAAGYADLANRVENTLDTRFATASAGKAFVAVGILQLVGRGLLRLDGRLGELVDFDLGSIDPDITVEQLLTHTSGAPDYFDESVMDEYEELWADYPNYKIRTNADLLPLFIGKPMMYPRGERFQYNNTGFVLLAMILERASAMAFDEYLEKNVFIPCGMASTGYYELDMLPANCANNYIYDERRGGYKTGIYSVDAKGTGAGGAYTTVGDVALFWDALLSSRLLTKELTAQMLSWHSGDDDGGCYGYGIWLENYGDGSFYPYFQGMDPGVSFVSAHDIKKNITLTLVSNYGDNVWAELKKLRETVDGG